MVRNQLKSIVLGSLMAVFALMPTKIMAQDAKALLNEVAAQVK